MQPITDLDISGQEEYIKGIGEILKSFKGSWPSFHDAEIYSINISRLTSAVEAGSVSIEFTVKMFRSFTECSLIVFRFHACAGISLRDFNQQNQLQDIEVFVAEQQTHSDNKVLPQETVVIYLGNHQISVPDKILVIKIVPEFGVESEFKCRKGEVIKFDPSVPC